MLLRPHLYLYRLIYQSDKGPFIMFPDTRTIEHSYMYAPSTIPVRVPDPVPYHDTQNYEPMHATFSRKHLQRSVFVSIRNS